MIAGSLKNILESVLKIGIIISIFLLFIGEISYLYYNATDIYVPAVDNHKVYFSSLKFELMEIGVLLIISLQFIRLLFIVGVYLSKKKFILAGMSLFILISLIISTFLHHF